MAKIRMSVSVEEDTKNRATALFERMDLDMSTAVGLFLNQCVKRGGLPFRLKAEPTAYEVVSETADYNAEPIMMGQYFVLEDYAAKHIHYYEERVAKGELTGLDVLHIMFSVMSIARDMFATPGELAADIAGSVFPGKFSCPLDEREFFDFLVVESPKEVSYKLLFGPTEQEIVTIKGFPACTLNRIEQAVAIRTGNPGFKLSQADIFNIIQYPMGWIYAIAQNRAKSVIKNGRRIEPEDMEYFVDGIMSEIACVKRDYDMAMVLPGFEVGSTYGIECNIPG